MMKVATPPLLGADDPAPVDMMNAASDSPVLLLCEHAGRAIPAALNGLGVSQDVIDSHRGWDIGAETVARGLAMRLGAPLIIQRYSRLVIDANRPPETAQSVPEVSDGAAIPANLDLDPNQRQARVREIFQPMEAAITQLFDRSARRFAFSIHSFTPNLAGQDRHWHMGFLTRTKPDCARRLMAQIQAAAPDAVLALNEPYQIEDETDWFIPVHAEPRDIPHCLIEIRNDLISDGAGAERWTGLLADALLHLMETSQ